VAGALRGCGVGEGRWKPCECCGVAGMGNGKSPARGSLDRNDDACHAKTCAMRTLAPPLLLCFLYSPTVGGTWPLSHLCICPRWLLPDSATDDHIGIGRVALALQAARFVSRPSLRAEHLVRVPTTPDVSFVSYWNLWHFFRCSAPAPFALWFPPPVVLCCSFFSELVSYRMFDCLLYIILHFLFSCSIILVPCPQSVSCCPFCSFQPTPHTGLVPHLSLVRLP